MDSSGVKVPGIRMIDAAGGVLGIEWVDGMNVRVLLAGDAEPEDAGVGEDEPEPDCADAEGEDEVDPLGVYGISRDAQMGKDAPRGYHPWEPHVVEYDAPARAQRSHKAVDLYVLERAFASTHPDSEPLFASVLAAYGARMGSAQWASVKKRLDDGLFVCFALAAVLFAEGSTYAVRLRGRKWNMVG